MSEALAANAIEAGGGTTDAVVGDTVQHGALQLAASTFLRSLLITVVGMATCDIVC